MHRMPIVKNAQILKEDKAKIKLALISEDIKKQILQEASFEEIVDDLKNEVKLSQRLVSLTKKSLTSHSAKADVITKFLDDIETKQTSRLANLQDEKLSSKTREDEAKSLKKVNSLVMGYVRTIVSIPNMLLAIKGFKDKTEEELNQGGKKSLKDLFPTESVTFKSNLASIFDKNASKLAKEADVDVDFSIISDELITIPVIAFNKLTGESRQSSSQLEKASEETSSDVSEEEDVEELDAEEMKAVNNLFNFLKDKSKKDPAKIDDFLNKLKEKGIDLDELNKLIQ
jgi:hypothetical protein